MRSFICNTLKKFELFLLLFASLFLLPPNQAHAYPAPKFDDVLLYSTQKPDGSIFTQFYATISGPSPQDVASFTATGPSGTFSLTPSISFKERGLCYYNSYSEGTGIIEPGDYTFQITDSTGRSATAIRNFSYDGPLPLVDSETMSPANYSYVGTTTPTLSFDAVEGSVFYSIQIRDYDSKAAWYVSPSITSTSFTVPSGVLQPNTAYRWWVRVRDSDTNPQKESLSNTFYFYTGTKGDPELTSNGVMSLPVGDSFQYLLNYAWAICDNVAPWDIQSFTVTGPDLTVFDLANARTWTFYSPNGNNGQLYLDPPTQSIPDGPYTIEITDNLENTVTTNTTYAYNPVPDFSADTRVPADNAYFDNNTPSFSWSRVTGDTGDGSYRYTIRIVDYADRIRWYDSPSIADTSFTLPESLNLPRGSSYKWRVNVFGPAGSGGTDSNNYRMSTYRTFTINESTTPPTVTTTTPYAITQTSATSGGTIISSGGATVTARGVCWSTSTNPTLSNSHTVDGSGPGTFTSSLSNLNSGTLYYVRAYATNSAGTGYSNQTTFTTLNSPTITSFHPTSGGNSTSVIITGTDFTDTTEVKFGDTSAKSFLVDSETQITAVVGEGSTGKISVTTPGGTAESTNDFIYTTNTAGTYYVNVQSGSDSNDGKSSETAWKTLHYALNQINGGDPGDYTLNVALGTYRVPSGEADEPMLLSQSTVTIIGESGSAPVINGAGANHWIKGFSVESSNITIRNFNITGFSDAGEIGIEFKAGSNNVAEKCNIYGNHEGIHIGSASSTIKGCEIYQNTQGIICYNNCLISQNKIHDNSGYGVFTENSDPEVSRNEIYDNLSGIAVSATAAGVASPTIKNNRIYETTPAFMDYGIVVIGNGGVSRPTLYHNSIDGGSGDGIAIEQTTTSTLEPVIKYNIITRCDLYGIDVAAGINYTIDYNDVWQNTQGNYNGCSAGQNDISQDPKNGQSGELAPDSPCINTIPTGDPVKIDYPGYSRPKGSRFDMGAYEYVGPQTDAYPLQGGTGQLTDYHIFTVPFNMTGAEMLGQMEATLGTCNDSLWRVFAYTGSNYLEINSSGFASLNIMPGMGFWIISILNDVIPFQGSIVPDGVNYELSIPSGWSLVALPWTGTNINLGNIQVTDGLKNYSITSANNPLTQRCVWHYTGNGPYNGYEKLDLSTNTLQCGTGYFFKVLTTGNVTMIFPPVNNLQNNVRVERGSPGDEEEPPPPPGGYSCPDISSGRLENITFPSYAVCQYTYRGTLNIGKGVTMKKGAVVTIKADKVIIESPFDAENGAVVKILQWRARDDFFPVSKESNF